MASSNTRSESHNGGGSGNNNTFLSRVFGMNSSFPSNSPLFTDDNDTELSLYHEGLGNGTNSHGNDLHSDEEEFFNSNHDDGDNYDSEDEDFGDGNDSSDQDEEEMELIPESLMVDNSSRPNRKKAAPQNNNARDHRSEEGIRFPIQGILMNKNNKLDANVHDISARAKDLASKTLNKLSFNTESHQEEMADESLLPPPGSMNHKFNKQAKKQEKALRNKLGILTPLEKSLWVWANITNLDIFLSDVYSYYIGKGFQCILIENVCDLLTLSFILFLSVFMGNCVDYDILLNDNPTKFSDVKVPQCYSKIPFNQKFLIFAVAIFIILKVKTFVMKDLPKLREIRNFYKYLLNINDEELQTISWNSIVKKIMVLRDQNTTAVISENFGVINDDLKSKKRLNAHDIANRIMRKENYMIALFNKNILNLSIPLITKKNHGFLTKTLEWNLNLCIFDFIFDPKTGQLHKKFLKENNRLQLAKELKNRFILAGILNILLSPFVVAYFILYYFLKFFYEFRYNPNLINNREYTPLAMWKFREFNELEHLFKKRLSLSMEIASNYINQFPRKKYDIILKFCSFVSGSLLTILVILTIFDPESFLNFEITSKRTVLFYISTLGAIYTICQNSIHDENVVFEPEQNLTKLYKYTHYMPKEWEGKLHREEIKFEFSKFYNLRIVIILKELLSLLFLPIILFHSLPQSSTKIIDFFREFTVHIDELGYVCHFAMFNFEKKDKLRSEYYQSNDDKMMKSYLHFMENINNDESMDQVHFDSSIFNEAISTAGMRHPPPAGQQAAQNAQAVAARRRPVHSNLRNSYIMEESFDTNYSAGPSKMATTSTAAGGGAHTNLDDYDEEDEDDGGVLKFVNQFYNKR